MRLLIILPLILASTIAHGKVSARCEQEISDAERQVIHTNRMIDAGVESRNIQAAEARSLKQNATFVIEMAQRACERFGLDSQDAIRKRIGLALRQSR